MSFPQRVLTLAVLALGICSIVTLKDATRTLIPGDPHYYVVRQGVYLAVGVVLMLAVSRLDYARLRQFKNAIYVVLLVTILAVLGLGHAAKGSVRAINLPLFSFQASELGKVLLILALSALLVDRARELRQRDTTIRLMIAALIPPRLSAAAGGFAAVVTAFIDRRFRALLPPRDRAPARRSPRCRAANRPSC